MTPTVFATFATLTTPLATLTVLATLAAPPPPLILTLSITPPRTPPHPFPPLGMAGFKHLERRVFGDITAVSASQHQSTGKAVSQVPPMGPVHIGELLRKVLFRDPLSQ